jgi:RecA/RadA recombinase
MGLLVRQFREAIAKSKDFKLKAEAEFSVSYPTGFLAFDFMNGCAIHIKDKKTNTEMQYYSIGITDGSMVMVIGRSGCGKTTFVVQSAASIVEPFENGSIFHEDIEGGINSARVHTLTKWSEEKIESCYFIRNTGITAENFYQRMKMIYDLKMKSREDYIYDTGLIDFYGNRVYKLIPTVFILDSLALLMPETYAEEEELSGQMSATAAARANASVFKRIVPMLKSGNIILFIINHINQKIDINPMQRSKAQVSYLKQNEACPGGNTPIYLANTFIRCDDGTKLKSTEAFHIDGSIVDITLIKSRTNKAGKTCSLVFDQERGFDKELSMLLLIKNAGRLNGAGAYLYIGDHSEMKFQQKDFKNKIKDPDFAQIVMDELQDILISELSHTYGDDENEEKAIDITHNFITEFTRPKLIG